MDAFLLTETIRQHGKQGDQTLEYIGTLLHKQALADWKIYYQFQNTEQKSFAVLNSDIHYRLFQELSAVLPIRMCDYSHSAAGKRGNMRSLCLFPMRADYDAVLKAVSGLTWIPAGLLERLVYLMTAVHSAFPADFSPLIQLGFETDAGGAPAEMKYYLNLKTDYSVHPVLDEELLSRLEPLHAVSRPQYQSLFHIFDLLRDSHYYPTFIGINDSPEHEEFKLYFISSLFGRRLRREYHTQNMNVITRLVSDHHDLAFLDVLNQNHFWLEGVAVSFCNPETVRLYWRELD